MFFLSDISNAEFARKKGSKDKSKRKLGSLKTLSTPGGAAIGGVLGAGIGTLAAIKKGNPKYIFGGSLAGSLAGGLGGYYVGGKLDKSMKFGDHQAKLGKQIEKDKSKINKTLYKHLMVN